MSNELTVMASLLPVILLIAAVTHISDGCYIRSCPMRVSKVHKRLPTANFDKDAQLEVHQCPKCGPMGLGQCVGPDTCCDKLNCWFGGRVTHVCRQETTQVSPCQLRGQTCGQYSDGLCLSHKICCSEGTCGPAKMGECTEIPEDLEEAELLERLETPDSRLSA